MLAQQKTKIVVRSWTATNVDAKKNISYLKNPVFVHENSILTCDSAVLYINENVFDAYNNVHINQGDTINIYSTRLNYNGNTKIAHLTENVRMVDNQSVLTTNILDYNMATKIGTYITGGKIVGKDATITSKNGYYFSNSRDAYFRYDVKVVTPESVITSDTLRYNTLTNWSYFYGPTNIKGKDDNLYTEDGAYNTKTQYAYFGKKNLYTMGAKSLKGDSLYYDGIAGYGKAVRNIVFKDTTDKTVMYGHLGFYYKKDERTLVTRNPYIGLGTADSIKVNDKLQPDSLWMGADTLETQMVLKKSLTLISSPVIKKDNELGEADEETPEKKISTTKPKAKATEETISPKKQGRIDKKNAKAEKEAPKKPLIGDKITLGNDSLLRDSVAKDSLNLLKKAVPILKDSILTAKADSVVKKGKDSISKVLKTVTPLAKADTSLKGKAVTDKIKAAAPGTKLLNGKIQGKQSALKDSIPSNPEDTVRTRIIKAYHNVRVHKANMQAKADSLFYTAADSTLRWYRNPILWAEGSQQTGDTIYLQLKNKKLRTLQVIQNAFLVNVNADSAKYNQIKGRLITAFFNEGKLENMFVDGNAESIYFNQNDKKVYTDMNQTVSSRIKILFKNKEIARIVTIKEPEGVRTPVPELKEDVFLTGFIWKPELRPRSKKEVINGRVQAKPAAKKAATPGKGTAVKGATKAPATTKPASTTKVPGNTKPAAVPKDTTNQKTVIKPVVPPVQKEKDVKADTVKKKESDTLKAVPLKK
ncbi:OstA-like protein [Pedobacter nyackensis]|uniref:OstA-like protein n=1 Tax=Pedobacter nyackensis TaxID=475255 RepID=UPI00292D7FD5|nr:OstA-like protein [Pedobacter nyackensis]